jgi:iron uptake system EfeUOB component EfeO/EfeM
LRTHSGNPHVQSHRPLPAAGPAGRLQQGKPASAARAAPAIPIVNVGVTDEACEPMQLTVKRGKTQFLIKNNSARAVEWEILKGVYVVEERENIARLQPEADRQTRTRQIRNDLRTAEQSAWCIDR